MTSDGGDHADRRQRRGARDRHGPRIARDTRPLPTRCEPEHAARLKTHAAGNGGTQPGGRPRKRVHELDAIADVGRERLEAQARAAMRRRCARCRRRPTTPSRDRPTRQAARGSATTDAMNASRAATKSWRSYAATPSIERLTRDRRRRTRARSPTPTASKPDDARTPADRRCVRGNASLIHALCTAARARTRRVVGKQSRSPRTRLHRARAGNARRRARGRRHTTAPERARERTRSRERSPASSPSRSASAHGVCASNFARVARERRDRFASVSEARAALRRPLGLATTALARAQRSARAAGRARATPRTRGCS